MFKIHSEVPVKAFPIGKFETEINLNLRETHINTGKILTLGLMAGNLLIVLTPSPGYLGEVVQRGKREKGE